MQSRHPRQHRLALRAVLKDASAEGSRWSAKSTFPMWKCARALVGLSFSAASKLPAASAFLLLQVRSHRKSRHACRSIQIVTNCCSFHPKQKTSVESSVSPKLAHLICIPCSMHRTGACCSALGEALLPPVNVCDTLTGLMRHADSSPVKAPASAYLAVRREPMAM